MKTSEAYTLISELRKIGHSVATLCQILGVSQSGYFESIKRAQSSRSKRRESYSKKVIAIFNAHKSRYGRPRIYQELKAKGEKISERMVGSIIKEHGLKALKKRPFRPQTTQQSNINRYAPNLLKDLPNATSPNQVLVSDITYVATREGWLYLAGIMDVKTRYVKGYSLQEKMPTTLVTQALDQALRRHPEIEGAILHSDRGCQYTSHDYLQKLKDHGFQVSMSGQGYCYDNAAMESFWSTLKTECFPASGTFETKEVAHQAIFEYIEGYYHTQRLHSSLGYLTPLAAEIAA